MINQKLVFILLCAALCASAFRVRDNCNNFDDQNSCKGNQTDNDQSWANRSFQTPPRSSPLWR